MHYWEFLSSTINKDDIIHEVEKHDKYSAKSIQIKLSKKRQEYDHNVKDRDICM